MRRPLAALAAATLALAAPLVAACAPCRPGRAPVEPRVGGAVGGGSGGFWNEGWFSLDVSNLFCREPGRPDAGAEREDADADAAEGAGTR